MRRTAVTLVALALAGVVVGCGGEGSTTEPADRSTPDAVVLELGGPSSAKCMVPNARTLSDFTVAFSGTVTSVEGDEATLDVDRWYAGGDSGQAVVRTTDVPITETGLFDLKKQKRYLISGRQGRVSLCGFSAAWSPELERLYQRAFPR